MYIYAFQSHDSYRDRAIKYLNFEPNVDAHFFLTPLPHSCGRLLWMTPKITLFYLCKYCLLSSRIFLKSFTNIVMPVATRKSNTIVIKL